MDLSMTKTTFLDRVDDLRCVVEVLSKDTRAEKLCKSGLQAESGLHEIGREKWTTCKCGEWIGSVGLDPFGPVRAPHVMTGTARHERRSA